MPFWDIRFWGDEALPSQERAYRLVKMALRVPKTPESHGSQLEQICETLNRSVTQTTAIQWPTQNKY
eukprot:4634162-Amphidinium_carterae.1